MAKKQNQLANQQLFTMLVLNFFKKSNFEVYKNINKVLTFNK